MVSLSFFSMMLVQHNCLSYILQSKFEVILLNSFETPGWRNDKEGISQRVDSDMSIKEFAELILSVKCDEKKANNAIGRQSM